MTPEPPGSGLVIRMFPPVSSGSAYVVAFAASLTAAGHVVDDDASSPDVFHHHWPEAPFNAGSRSEMLKGIARYSWQIAAMRARGATLVWTVHNLEGHEGRWKGERLYLAGLSRVVHCWFTLSDFAELQATRRWPALATKPHAVLDMGDLTTLLPPPPSKRDARRRLGLGDHPTIAFVGSVRPYKGVDDLREASRPLLENEAQLVLGGEVHPECRSLRSSADRVKVIDRKLSDTEFVDVVAAADLVVLPFKRVTHSASAVTVAGLGRPVLVPALGALPEYAARSDGAIRLYDPPLDAATLQRALRRALDSPGIGRPERMAWSTIAGSVLDVYEHRTRAGGTDDRTWGQVAAGARRLGRSVAWRTRGARRSTLARRAELQWAQLRRRSAHLDSVVVLVGPYRNLTTLTVSVFALHPNIQVLNHASDRILPYAEVNFLNHPDVATFERFQRAALHLSAGGEQGRWGGSILESHAFERPDLARRYRDRFGERTIKADPRALVWKESMRVTRHVLDHGIDASVVLEALPTLKLLLPVRNPLDCAASNLRTGHIQWLDPDGGDDLHGAVDAVLDVIAWFEPLVERFADRCAFLHEHDLDDGTPDVLARFVGLPADDQWRADARACFRSDARHAHPAAAVAHYRREVGRRFSGALREALLAHISEPTDRS